MWVAVADRLKRLQSHLKRMSMATSIWDKDALNAWAKDEDVLSWRSFDTTTQAEADILSETASGDVSDADELAELIDRRLIDIGVVRRNPASSGSHITNKEEYEPVPTYNSIAISNDVAQVHPQNPTNTVNRVTLRVERHKNPVSTANLPLELPSTSEMVGIEEVARVQKVPSSYSQGPSGQATKEDMWIAPSPEHQSVQLRGNMNEYMAFEHQSIVEEPKKIHPFQFDRNDVPVEVDHPLPSHQNNQDNPCSHSVIHSQNRMSMSLNEFLSMKEFSRQETMDVRPHDLKHQEEREIQQRHIQRLIEEVEDKNAQLVDMREEESKWKTTLMHLENQIRQLQSALTEREKNEEMHLQLLTQKNDEIAALHVKYCSLQDANENYQEQARKAVDERDRVQRDYMQVVYELGKVQKQLNALSKDTSGATERDGLQREIQQLQIDKEQLLQKLKEAESKRASGITQSTDTQMLYMQRHIQELEDEVRCLRSARMAPAPAPPLQAPFVPNTNVIAEHSMQSQSKNIHHQHAVNERFPMTSKSLDFSSLGGMVSTTGGRHDFSYHEMSYPPPIPSVSRFTAESFGSGRKVSDLPLSLKDILAEQRRLPSSIPGSRNDYDEHSSHNVLAHSYGGESQSSDMSKLKTDAMTRRNNMSNSTSSIADLLKQPSLTHSSSPAFNGMLRAMPTSSADITLGASFAAEKQVFVPNAVEKQQLEEQLMNLHVEKEQTEAKLSKLEQKGVRTMSARTQKASLETKLQSLTHSISKIKLILR